jgi:hypothetical protein
MMPSWMPRQWLTSISITLRDWRSWRTSRKSKLLNFLLKRSMLQRTHLTVLPRRQHSIQNPSKSILKVARSYWSNFRSTKLKAKYGATSKETEANKSVHAVYQGKVPCIRPWQHSRGKLKRTSIGDFGQLAALTMKPPPYNAKRNVLTRRHQGESVLLGLSSSPNFLK